MASASSLGREYLSGSLASCTTAALFSPLECVKTRLQLQDMPGWRRIYTRGFLHALQQIYRQDGLLLLWSHGFAGLVARDFFYSGMRTGMYPTVRGLIAPGRAPGDISLAEKILAGAVTGGLGAGLANPFDVVRVRMTAEGGVVGADGLLATGMRAGELPRWGSSLACAADAARQEGVVQGLMVRGASASVSRAALLTAAQLSSYDHAKVHLRPALGDGTLLHVAAAVISGFVATAACNPADVVKSRVMSARGGSGGGGGGGGAAGMVVEVWRREGVRGFYRGFLPAYARIGPTIFIQMPLAELLRSALGVQAL